MFRTPNIFSDLFDRSRDFLDNLMEHARKWWDQLDGAWSGFLSGVTDDPRALAHSTEILIGLLLLSLLILIGIVIKLTRGSAPPRIGSGKFESPKEMKKAAKRAAKSGNFIRAGELYEKGGHPRQAVAMFIKGGAFTKAAQVYAKKLGDPEQGIALLIENGLNDPAASLLAQIGRHGEAARYYLKAGKEMLAAENFQKAGEHKSAGELYAKLKSPKEAALSFAKAKAWKEAGDNYELWFLEFRRSLEGKEQGKALNQLQELGKAAAYHLRQAGEFKRAADICLAARLPLPAAELLTQAGEFERAADIYFDKRDLKKAAELYNRAGLKKRAAEIVAQLCQKEGRALEAAKYHEFAENWLEAADIYAGASQFEKAAELYLKGGDSRTASEMFLAAELPERALKVFEDLGDQEAAIRLLEETGNPSLLAGLYERKGKFYEAALSWLEQGETEKGTSLLTKLPPEHPRFGEAMARLGGILMQQGKHREALDKLQLMAGRIPLSPTSLDHYYLLGQAYEFLSHPMEAAAIYQQLLALNPAYKDAAMRLQVVMQQISQQGAVHAATREGGAVAKRYSDYQELGRGGMGVVYLATDTQLDRKVAIKILPRDLKTQPQLVELFLREAKSLAKLNHPNIVSIYDAGVENEVYYIIMEFVEGKDLSELLEGHRRLPLAGGIQVFKELAQALNYAHELKIIHRDIKPANLMYSVKTKIVKVMDFGLAKVMDQVREGRTMIAGTPYYMSPEQNLGRNVDHRTDIYAMGITMFELFTGRVPFMEGDIGYHHLHTPPPRPREFNPQLPDKIEHIILKCIAKDPAQRYQSAGRVYDELMTNFGHGRSLE